MPVANIPTDEPTIDARITADVADIRARFTDTHDIYRELATVLFFRYGITPTGNKLYQLVRKGSMSAPAQALADFWDTLREKSRVRVTHAELPPALADAAGELVATLWRKAAVSAQEQLEVQRNEADERVQQADAARDAAITEKTRADAESVALRETIASQRATYEQKLAEAERSAQEASMTVDGLRHEVARLMTALGDAHRQHSERVEAIEASSRAAVAEVQVQLAQERERAAGERLALMRQTDELRRDNAEALKFANARALDAQAAVERVREDAEQTRKELARIMAVNAGLERENALHASQRTALETELQEQRHMLAEARRHAEEQVARIERYVEEQYRLTARAERAEAQLQRSE
jgi:hypothetical protein